MDAGLYQLGKFTLKHGFYMGRTLFYRVPRWTGWEIHDWWDQTGKTARNMAGGNREAVRRGWEGIWAKNLPPLPRVPFGNDLDEPLRLKGTTQRHLIEDLSGRVARMHLEAFDRRIKEILKGGGYFGIQSVLQNPELREKVLDKLSDIEGNNLQRKLWGAWELTKIQHTYDLSRENASLSFTEAIIKAFRKQLIDMSGDLGKTFNDLIRRLFGGLLR